MSPRTGKEERGFTAKASKKGVQQESQNFKQNPRQQGRSQARSQGEGVQKVPKAKIVLFWSAFFIGAANKHRFAAPPSDGGGPTGPGAGGGPSQNFARREGLGQGDDPGLLVPDASRQEAEAKYRMFGSLILQVGFGMLGGVGVPLVVPAWREGGRGMCSNIGRR